jgi:aryl-alcohol dehydrogenase-like predicted oxidoreductase
MTGSAAAITPRPLGSAGAAVHPIGLGCMGFAWAYTQTSTEPAVEVVHAALDAGAAHLDTSDVYGPFESERLLGRALAGGRRAEAFVATKGGLVADGGHGSIRRDGRPEHLVSACEASLLRLGLDRVDLYYLHRLDETVPVEESWGALAGLVERGLVRALGVSEASVTELDRLQAVHPVAAVQSELSVWTRDRLDDVLPWCRRHGAAFVAFAPLGRGFLTGTVSRREDVSEDDFRARLPRFADDALAANAAIVDGLRTVAARHQGATSGQVALAWVLAQGEHVHAIPGTTRQAHLLANLAAASLVLDEPDLALLDALPAPVGARY